MLTFHSFLQTVYQFVKSLAVRMTKRLYRCAAVFTTGAAVLAVIILTSIGFGGGGKNALAAFSESEPKQEDSLNEAEENEFSTEAKIQIELTDLRRQGQLLVGGLLTKEVQSKQEDQLVAQAEIEKVKKEIELQKQAEIEAAAKAAAIQAEKDARKAAAVVHYSDEDYQVLLKIVQAEAGICDTKGKILVANVILNRVKSTEFPNNITDVVYEKSQFSPVSDGAINTVKITEQTIECVNRALSGEDYSQGALYFMNRRSSESRLVHWFDGRLELLFQHQSHEFFK